MPSFMFITIISSLLVPNSILKPSKEWESIDVKLLKTDQVKLTLGIWSSKDEWYNNDIKNMQKLVYNENDINYLAYCPFYKNKQTIRYIFSSRIINDKNVAYLSILSCAKCPFDESNISSANFKIALESNIPNVIIKYDSLLKDPKIKLTWDYYHKYLEKEL